MNKVFLLLCFMLFSCVARASSPVDSLIVMFYNVENFFDCKHDSLKNDSEFLPGSIRAWNMRRFKEKALHVSQVIVNSGKGDIPALVGMCEVENEYVMDYLTKYSPLKQLTYRYVMTDSRDPRGIDVALLYQREKFKPIYSKSIVIDTESVGHAPTRDILHCCGLTVSGDTLDVFVCHLPSRRGNSRSALDARHLAFTRLRQYADSIRAERKVPNIIIMGDMNTYVEEKELDEYFVSGDYSLLTFRYRNRTDIGTYKYHGIWQTLDHMVANSELHRRRNGIYISDTRIVDDDYLLVRDEKYLDLRPFRTYYGIKYAGGYSDHLPIISILYFPE